MKLFATQLHINTKFECPSSILTGNNVTETDGGHGDETKVEGLEEGPLFKVGEDVASTRQKHPQRSQGAESHVPSAAANSLYVGNARRQPQLWHLSPGA